MVCLILSMQQSFFMDHIGSKTATSLHNFDIIVLSTSALVYSFSQINAQQQKLLL